LRTLPQQSLSDLIGTLSACNPYFVRCIKPNKQKISGRVEWNLILAQLRYSGMLETIRIRRAGYPVRYEYPTFVRRFRVIASDAGNAESAAATKKIMEKLTSVSRDDWQLGKTKLFMRSSVETALENARNAVILKQVIKLQAFFKMVVYRKRYLRIKKALKVLQKRKSDTVS
jgi:myosin heavy subunit